MNRTTILLVEDEALIALAERMVLEKNGYSVVTASSGEQAIARFCDTPDIDLVLMDIDLGPGMLGTEAAGQILAHREVPLVFLSSHTEPEIVKQTEGITSYGYIVKHTGDTVLLASIRMAFRLHQARINEREALHRLGQSRDLMNYVIGCSRTGIAVHDRELRYLYVSEAYLQMYSVSAADVIGKHHYEVFPDLPQKWRRVHQRALAGEVVSSDDDEFVRSDGTVLWTRWECRPWYENDGSVGGIIINTQVINEQKRLEQALRSSEHRFRYIMESMQDVVFTLDTDLRHTGVYGRWLQNYHMTPEQFLGKTVSELLGDEAAPEHEAAARRALADGFAVYEWSVPRADGRAFFQTSLSRITDPDGQITGLVGIGREITDLKQTEALLTAQNRSLEHLLSVGDSLSSTLNIAEILQTAASSAVKLTDLNSAAIYLIDDDSLFLAATIPPLPAEFPDEFRTARRCDHPHVERVVMNREVVVFPDFSKDELSPAERTVCEARGLRTLAMVPLVGRRESIGVLLVGSTGEPREITASHVAHCRIIAGQVAIAVENARLHQSISSELEERTRAEQALRVSSVQLSRAMVIARLGHWEYDVASDLFTFSDSFYEMLRTTAAAQGGYQMSSAEYAGRFLHLEDAHIVADELDSALAAPSESYHSAVEHRVRFGDGELGVISVKIFVVKDESGATVKLYGVNQDITNHGK
ncbi:MAG: PAS domain S-box protein [Spirochaetaceae bacterium]|nr:MAG: PAS domain S-box protein [Spirochaetaceae bacterium]